MEKAIKLLSLVDEYDFINIYLIIDNKNIIKSIPFLYRKQAQEQCEYLNNLYHTNYHVYKTCTHI